MKKRELLVLNRSLTMLEGRQFSVKFSYFIAKNKVQLKNEFTALEEARKPSAAYIAFDTERAKLAHDMADKDDKGQSKIENNNFIIIENVDEFRKQLEALKIKNDEVIKIQEQKVNEFEELLNEEINYDGPKIEYKDIPKTVEPSVLESLIIADLIIEE